MSSRTFTVNGDRGDLVDQIRDWVRRELPHVTEPPASVIEQLVQGGTAAEIWKFLVNRVVSEKNATKVRDVLSIYPLSEHQTAADTSAIDAELNEVNKETEAIEREIAALQQEIIELNGLEESLLPAFGTDEHAVRNALLTDAVEALDDGEQFCTEIHEFLRDKFPGASTENTTEKKDETESKITKLVAETQECINDATEALLGNNGGIETQSREQLNGVRSEIEYICERWSVNSICKSLMHLATIEDTKCKSSRPDDLVIYASSTDDATSDSSSKLFSDITQAARDKYLEVFGDAENMRLGCENAQAELSREIGTFDSHAADNVDETLTVLCAKVEGERAALKCLDSLLEKCKNEHVAAAIVGGERALADALALENEVENQNKRIEVLDDALSTLAKSNRNYLEKLSKMGELFDMYLERELKELKENAAEHVQNVMNESIGNLEKLRTLALNEILSDMVAAKTPSCPWRGDLNLKSAALAFIEERSIKACELDVEKRIESAHSLLQQYISEHAQSTEHAVRNLELSLRSACEDARRCREEVVPAAARELQLQLQWQQWMSARSHAQSMDAQDGSRT